MPRVFKCPGCGKKLKVLDELAGKKVRCPNCKAALAIPALPTADVVAAAASAASPPKIVQPAVAAVPQTTAVADAAGFEPLPDLDDQLRLGSELPPADSRALPPRPVMALTGTSSVRRDRPVGGGRAAKTPRKRKTKKEGPRWGFRWDKVGSGLIMMLIGGGISFGLWQVGRISIWAVGLAIVGAFTMLNGLVGEEGVW